MSLSLFLRVWVCACVTQQFFLSLPDRADDVASDFTLRGLNVQSIHGDRWVAACGSSNEV